MKTAEQRLKYLRGKGGYIPKIDKVGELGWSCSVHYPGKLPRYYYDSVGWSESLGSELYFFRTFDEALDEAISYIDEQLEKEKSLVDKIMDDLKPHIYHGFDEIRSILEKHLKQVDQ